MRQKTKTRSRAQSAQSIIETVVGIIFLIPIVLLMFDVGVLVLANTSNDNLAKQAARAAAGAPGTAGVGPGDPSFFTNAQAAAGAVVTRYAHNCSPGGMFAGVNMAYIRYRDVTDAAGVGALPAGAQSDPGAGNVEVITTFMVQCPVAFPGFDGKKTFTSRAVEPIVSQPP